MSPMLKKGVGMGYVKTDFSENETIIFIEVRNRLLKAKVTKPPFVKV